LRQNRQRDVAPGQDPIAAAGSVFFIIISASSSPAAFVASAILRGTVYRGLVLEEGSTFARRARAALGCRSARKADVLVPGVGANFGAGAVIAAVGASMVPRDSAESLLIRATRGGRS
jgi:hypothetical protein